MRRMGSVITCNGRTELLVIYKEDYYNIVSVMMQSDLMDKISLLRRTEMFKVARCTTHIPLPEHASSYYCHIDSLLWARDVVGRNRMSCI